MVSPDIDHTVEQYERQDLQTGKFFYPFRNLPAELRCIIWEFSWPETRIIEVVNTNFDTETAKYTGTTFLLPAGPLSTFLKTDFGGDRSLDNKGPFEKCLHPTALQICQESRNHTLSRYRVIQNSVPAANLLFFSLSRDILWLCRELTGQPKCLDDLKRTYGRQLDCITTLLVEEAEWTYITPTKYAANYLVSLIGLKTIVLVYGIIDKDGNLIAEAVAPENRIVAEQLPLKFSDLYISECMTSTLHYTDRNGKFY
ncbi:hypothetical protein OIDMADRAFT_61594 [Oidiodendron maius Zn]|uniref:2EXR domain-containing protein n=1 Tax=Oidiodendron maius (strain Zn) TaxID=913774 RepID=A0A0C3GB84_OIDMZ|nr:hypothetical protein OIDMADRAFT_61594 [Oidiodendron maius Zn]